MSYKATYLIAPGLAFLVGLGYANDIEIENYYLPIIGMAAMLPPLVKASLADNLENKLKPIALSGLISSSLTLGGLILGYTTGSLPKF